MTTEASKKLHTSRLTDVALAREKMLKKVTKNDYENVTFLANMIKISGEVKLFNDDSNTFYWYIFLKKLQQAI